MRGAGGQDDAQAVPPRCSMRATAGAERGEAGMVLARARVRACAMVPCVSDACLCVLGTDTECVRRTCAHGARAVTYLSLRLGSKTAHLGL